VREEGRCGGVLGVVGGSMGKFGLVVGWQVYAAMVCWWEHGGTKK